MAWLQNMLNKDRLPRPEAMETLIYTFPMLASIREFLELGGGILLAVALLTLFMWTLIIERLCYFRYSHPENIRRALNLWSARTERATWYAHQVRERVISMVAQQGNQHLRLIKTCVALCPLLGLLGTVTGMVEVFETMAALGSSNPRLMAAGVSKATIPTMAGMVAALSGVAMSAWLHKRAQRENLLLAEHMTTDH